MEKTILHTCTKFQERILNYLGRDICMDKTMVVNTEYNGVAIPGNGCIEFILCERVERFDKEHPIEVFGAIFYNTMLSGYKYSYLKVHFDAYQYGWNQKRYNVDVLEEKFLYYTDTEDNKVETLVSESYKIN